MDGPRSEPTPRNPGSRSSAAGGATSGGDGDADDSELVAKAIAGDRRAYETLLRRHMALMHRVARGMVGPTDAEDVAQDVCCTLFTRLGSFRGESKFKTWLCGVVVNQGLDHLRARKRLQRLRDGLTDDLATTSGRARSELTTVSQPAPLPHAGHPDETIWRRKLVARLDPENLAVAVLMALGLKHAEIAALRGVAESTISWRVHEIRKTLWAADAEAERHHPPPIPRTNPPPPEKKS